MAWEKCFSAAAQTARLVLHASVTSACSADMSRDFGQTLDGQPNGESDVNEVRASHRLVQLRTGFIDHAQLQGAFEHGGLVPPDESDTFLCAQ